MPTIPSLGLFASIGIRKGQPFAPDERMKQLLREGVAIGNAAARSISFANRDRTVYTMPGKSYLVFLRLYGPLEPWFDKTWKPGDFEKLD